MAKGSDRARAAACPCGSGTAYSRCCRVYHLGQARPGTAELLMRARYAAYAKRLPDYVASTWHPVTRPEQIELDRRQRWTGLEIVATVAGEADDVSGTVEFVAHHDTEGRRGELQEVSRFERVEGEWLYLDGEITPRNGSRATSASRPPHSSHRHGS